MTNKSYYDKPDLEELMHFGVKGMKWGRRKARPTTSEIHGARKEMNAYEKKYGKLEDKLYEPGNSSAQNKKLESEMKKLETEFKNNPQRAVALRQTRGEQVATIILGGPIGLAAVGGNAIVANRVAKGIEKRNPTKATPKNSGLNPKVSRGK